MSFEIHRYDPSDGEQLRLTGKKLAECEEYIRLALADVFPALMLEPFRLVPWGKGWRITSVSRRTEPQEEIELYCDPEVELPSFRDITRWVRARIEYIAGKYGDGDFVRGLLSIMEARLRNEDPFAICHQGLLGLGSPLPGLILVENLTEDEMRDCADDTGCQGSKMQFTSYHVEPNKRWEVQRADLINKAREERAKGFSFFLVNKRENGDIVIGVAPAVGQDYPYPKPHEEDRPSDKAA